MCSSYGRSSMSRKVPLSFLMSVFSSLHMYQRFVLYEDQLQTQHFVQIRQNLDDLHEDVNTLILLTAVRNVLRLENRAKKTKFCVSMATMNTLMSLTDTCMSTAIKMRCIVAFSWEQWLSERATIVRYKYTCCPEERRSHLHHCRSLKSRIACLVKT